MSAGVEKQDHPDVAATDQIHDLGWALGAVLRSWQKATNEAVANLPGGPRGYQVLSMATGGPCGTQAAMAERVGIDRTVMTHLIDDLEDDGLVVRTPDPADRRAPADLTHPDGLAAYTSAEIQIAALERDVLAGLDDGAVEVFRTLLFRAAASVDDRPHDACEAVLELDKRG